MVFYVFDKTVKDRPYSSFDESFTISTYTLSGETYSFQTTCRSSDEYGPDGDTEYNTGAKNGEIDPSYIVTYKGNVYLLPEVFLGIQVATEEMFDENKTFVSTLVEKATVKLSAGIKLYHYKVDWPKKDKGVIVTISQTVYVKKGNVYCLHNDEKVTVEVDKLEEVTVPQYSIMAAFRQWVGTI